MKLKFLILISLISLNISAQEWGADLDSAKMNTDTSKLILLNFSGSDWCIPCKKLKKGLFKDSTFLQFADTSLILVNADFPSKKNVITAEQLKKNEQLAEKYNPKGVFPYTILLNKDGKELGKWSGLISMPAQDFISQIKKMSISQK